MRLLNARLIADSVGYGLRRLTLHCTMPPYLVANYSNTQVRCPMSVITVIAIATLLALVPTLFYALFIWWLDRHEKEPLPLLLVAFLWGAVPAILIAIVLE